MRGVRFGKLKQRPRSPKSKRGQREGAHHTGIYDSGRVGQQISHYMSTEETMRTYLGLPHKAATLKLYKNVGNGAFRDVTEQTGLDKVFMPTGLNFADIDNDGDEDILTIVGGAVRADSHQFRLFENPGNGNDWIRVHLVGVKANRAAIGARIKVTVDNQGHGTHSFYRWVGSGGSFGASPLEQHFGLGPSARIESLEVRWPGPANTTQKFLDVGKNQVIEIKENAPNYTKLVRPKFRLGGRQEGCCISGKIGRAHTLRTRGPNSDA